MSARELPEAELFEGLDGAQRRILAPLARDRALREGEEAFRAGERADAFYVVREGRVDLTFAIRVNGEERAARLQGIGAGRILAWSALVPPHLLTLGARATTPAQLVAFDGLATLRLLEDRPDLGRVVLGNLARVVAGRFQELLALYLREVQRGVARGVR